MRRSFLYAIALFLLSPILGYAQTDTVKIQDNVFKPETLIVATGTQVVWIHEGSVTHTTTSGDNCSSNGIWDSGNMSNGDEFTHTFNTQGNYPYYCQPHCSSGMTGFIGVSDNVGIEERTAAVPELDLYPMPFDRTLKIGLKGDLSNVQSLSVIDMTGRSVKELPASEIEGKGPVQLDASDWESGVYFVKLTSEDGTRSRKVIKH